MNLIKSGLLTAILCFICTFSILAQSNKVVVVGKTTLLQKQVIGSKTIDQKQIERPTENSRKAPSADKLTRDIEAVYIDAKQFHNNELLENEYVKEAMTKHIPIVLEDVDKENLKQLAGIGINAKVAIVESRVDKRGVVLTIIDDEPQKGLKLAPAPAQPSDGKSDTSVKNLDKTKVSSDKIKELEKKAQIQTKPTKEEQLNQEMLKNKNLNTAKGKQQPTSLDILTKETKDALEEHKVKRTSRQVDNRTGSVEAPDFENAIASTDPYFLGFNEMINPVPVNGLPTYSEYHIDLNWAQRNWAVFDYTFFGTRIYQEARVNVNYDIVLYATTNPANKWMKITSKGSGVHPGNMLGNSYTTKGYYTDSFYQMFGPYFGGNGKSLDKSSPANVNSNGSVTTTTGFTVGQSVGVDANGPSTALSASYSSSKAISNNITDFKVKNNADSQWARFDYRLSKVSGSEYNTWQDLADDCLFCEPGLYNLPDWSTSNMPAYAEGVWKYPVDYNGDELLYFYQHHYMRYTYAHGDPFIKKWNTQTNNKRYDLFPTVDFSLVQLPHIGIEAKTQQSSVAHNGHQSRAVDGDINGNWGNNSVTHTNNDQNAYWEVEIDAKYANTVIKNLELWNRTDCCGDRLKNFVIFVSDTPFASKDFNATVAQANNSQGQIMMINHPDRVNRNKSFTLGRTARYIRIQLRDPGVLSLAEVRIVPKGYF